MMETIDNNTIQAAAEKVIQRQRPNYQNYTKQGGD